MFEAAGVGETIGANAELNAITEARFHEFNFIARTIGAFVATRENGDALALSEKTLCEPNYHGSFAGATEREIPDADYGRAQAPGAKNAFLVEPGTELDDGGINKG